MTRLSKVLVALAGAVVLGWQSHAVASAQPPCSDLGGFVEGSTCRIHAGTDTYAFNASFPMDYADPAPMVDYLRQTRDGFINVSQMPGARNLPYELDVKSASHRSGPPLVGTQSVVLEIFQDVSGAHPLTWYKSFNYNLETRQPITFETLFKPGTEPLGVIYPIVADDLERRTGIRDGILPGAGTDPSNYQNFAITDNELIFFFGQGELLPAAAGATVAHVPRQAVAAMMAYPATNP